MLSCSQCSAASVGRTTLTATVNRLQISYLMFHWVTGIPFGDTLHSGAYDELTMWEQIDDGAQYTPAKKWLICVPITLYAFTSSPP